MPSLRYRSSLIILVFAWLCLVLLAGHLLLSTEIERHKQHFLEDSESIVDTVKNRLDTNEAVLAGLTAFLQAVDQSDIESTARFASAMITAYPHIYMIEVARKVARQEEASLTQKLRQQWSPDFTLKNFAEIKQNDKARTTAPDTWPILFMYPALPEAKAIYGVRLETVDYLSQTLALAQSNPRPVASPVFEMYEGGKAYILLHEVNKPRKSGEGLNLFGNTMAALLLIKVDSLFPTLETSNWDHPGLSFRVFMSGEANPASTTPTLERQGKTGALIDNLLPRFAHTVKLDNATQRMEISFAQQLTWRELINTETLIILGLLAGALVSIPLLAHRHLVDIEKVAQEHEQAAHLATHDLLTGLPNRYLFADRFEKTLQQHERNGNAFALLLIDLDHFKEINDAHGHDVGDEVLVETARRMTQTLRAGDSVARHGGDEFVALLGNILDAGDAQVVGEKLLTEIAQPISSSVGTLSLTCSIGIAIYPLHGNTLNAMRLAADQAMYAAKHKGRDAISLFTD